MNKMTPEGLKQSPQKPIAKKFEKVEETPIAPIVDRVNWLNVFRLLFMKKIENAAFEEYQVSVGKVVSVTSAGTGIGFLANVNWALLLTGNPVEIIKVVIGVIGLAVAWFWKK